MLTVKYHLVRSQGIWPACVCHHLAINKQLPDVLLDHRFVSTIRKFNPVCRVQWNRAVHLSFAAGVAADDYGIVPGAMFACDCHVLMVTARFNDALVTRLLKIVNALLDRARCLVK